MTQAAQTALQTLLQFSAADREELAARLADSLDAGTETGAESEWDEELRARVEDVQSGRVKTVPWATAREQIMDDENG